jgi:hypothetical protein
LLTNQPVIAEGTLKMATNSKLMAKKKVQSSSNNTKLRKVVFGLTPKMAIKTKKATMVVKLRNMVTSTKHPKYIPNSKTLMVNGKQPLLELILNLNFHLKVLIHQLHTLLRLNQLRKLMVGMIIAHSKVTIIPQQMITCNLLHKLVRRIR